MKVLVAEGDEDSRNLLVKQLQIYGHEVIGVSNGAEALEKALKEKPEILVTDILVPHMDGFLLCHLWKQIEQLRPIPFIFYTSSYTSDEDRQFALSLGANAWVSKPTDPEKLVQVIMEAYEKAKSGLPSSPEVAPLEPSMYFNEYSKRLGTVLDKKVAKLEEEVAERKRVVEELQRHRERLEKLVEQRTKELEDTREQLELNERLAVLGQLASGVGHELRNPLGAIKNAAYFLNMVIEEPEEEVKETLEILEQEVVASERVISSLLDFASQKPPILRKVDLKDVVNKALSGINVPGNVEVVSQIDEALPEVIADPDQLGQVFTNIAYNAVQAMPEGGRLAVECQASGSEKVIISITDTGVGIPAEVLPKLFEPLFTTRAKGIGLGLAVAKTLVEGHGGTIEVQSEMGQGTTFTVILPLGMREDD